MKGETIKRLNKLRKEIANRLGARSWGELVIEAIDGYGHTAEERELCRARVSQLKHQEKRHQEKRHEVGSYEQLVCDLTGCEWAAEHPCYVCGELICIHCGCGCEGPT